MSGLTDYEAQNLLNYVVGKTAMPATPTVSVALFTAVGTDAGTGFTEVTGGSYARVTTAGGTWNAASGSHPSLISNSTAITFPTATASWGTVVAFGLYDAASAGNLLAWDYLGNFQWLQFSGNSASPCVLTAPAHGYATNDTVVVNTEYGGENLPATAGSWTGLLTVTLITADTFSAGVNSTGTGGGSVRKVTQQSVPSGVQVSFAGGAPGQLVINSA
jgi:hypothetical protein